MAFAEAVEAVCKKCGEAYRTFRVFPQLCRACELDADAPLRRNS